MEFQPQKFEREQQAKVNHSDTNEQTEAQGDHQDERTGLICSVSRGQNLSVGKKTGTAAQAWPEMKTIKKGNSEAFRRVQREERGNDLQTQVSFVKSTLCGRLSPRQKQNGLCVCVCIVCPNTLEMHIVL